MPSNNWYVVTGGPSTGKTTLLKELEALGYKTIPEAARTVIDKALEKGISLEALRSDEKRFQDDVARLKEEVEASHDKAVVTFFDRGMHDTAAYMRHYGFTIEEWLKALIGRSTYQKVFLLEPLPMYENDYARTEDHDFTKKLHTLLHDAYAEFGMEPIHVPAVSPSDRVRFILNTIGTE